MSFGDAAELGFPIAVAHDPIDVALAGIGFPAGGFGGGEIDVDGGALGVVGVEDGFDLVCALEGFGNSGLDALAGAVGDFAVEDLGGKGAAGAGEIATLQPSTHHALELAEEMELGLGARVAVLAEEEMFRQVEGDGGRAQSAEVFQGERVLEELVGHWGGCGYRRRWYAGSSDAG